MPAATASSGLAATYSTTTTTVCTVTSGGVISLVAVGSSTIAADQAGNGTYAAAPQVTQTFSVSKGNQAITFGVLADKTLAQSLVSTSASAHPASASPSPRRRTAGLSPMEVKAIHDAVGGDSLIQPIAA